MLPSQTHDLHQCMELHASSSTQIVCMQVICGEMELKIQPYEWVYDGLKPLFLDSIFDIKKGIHISLAALYCAIGRRLECPILPELASRARKLRQEGI